MTAPLPPVTGAWRDGDPVGRRHFVDIGDVHLESGTTLPDVRIAYQTWGELNAQRNNAVLVLHALTGDTHVVGPAEPGHPTPGWWDGLIGPGRAIDTRRWFVAAPNILGGCQGSTGPASLAADGQEWGSRFPYLTTRDQVTAERGWADALDIDTWGLVLGGSAGGMRALEWAVASPERVARLFILACTPYATADQIGWCTPQLAAIEGDPGYAHGDYYRLPSGHGPHQGLAVARRIAHMTYRSDVELNTRFGRSAQGEENPYDGAGRFAVQSYLDHHGDKLVHRFDANSYVVLTKAMNSHDVGRGRGGYQQALRRVTAQTVVAAIDSDRLYPVDLSEQLADAIPGAGEVQVIESLYGHDGFLLETEAVGKVLAPLLEPT